MDERNRQSLLEELDSRQNDLLAELEQLNQRIELTIRECLALANRGPEPLPGPV